MTTSQHCPGFEQLKDLESFICKCPECGKKIEVFSDELTATHICPKCGKKIDCTKCRKSLSGKGRTVGPR
jgi:predicted RNA-binding Zn-ribbon protein involved in translation (DUF1610 family)